MKTPYFYGVVKLQNAKLKQRCCNCYGDRELSDTFWLQQSE